ncbi:SDR family oxidoreductase [Domibacillus sp. DTU_2020_1001157_1_SI_ALB_TIR_016]|uniref:SDR family NAD(P)-dependent oxidoreductase n=1 Tax=Domibacillus sp. DTU_2020_1001157_1_SI_ALB_TIR_016 TaxID=3077789 RepID=UPI0028EA0714|nr:SDR family oxidoreductase [Domibacillus sp. DTU_2020_1001157_1_SI_ALB_TIR_016]WNS78005.1 SDR family oxidoreductase [Domibacillus sp. DTU_2020_1001157_1_SI_ALB_TIR_016]
MGKALKDVHIVVTGASSGLGYAMAEALLDEGATVALASRPGSKLTQAVNELKDKGYMAVFELPLDVRSEESVEEAVKWIKTEWGRIDVLINNAGIGMRTVNPKFLTEPQPFFNVTPEGFRDLMDTNVTGYFLTSRGFAPLMAERGRGKIINISMNYETMKRKGFVPYGPSRAATESMSYIMAEDLRDFGVSVNMLLPGGATLTGMIPNEVRKELEGNFELLKPEIMAKAIVFLASEQSEGITGERIVAAEFEKWLKQRSN